ncbi:APC family permease [bacterium]|jgi:amino acid transporter|nr:APC family permease [bacterium]
MKENKIPLWTAILVNVNIMLGVGIFINTIVLSRLSGVLGFLSYAVVGILMLPLVLSMAKLVSAIPSGGFYAYGKTLLHPFAGFLSSWSYFWGKLASCTLMIHIFTTTLYAFAPTLKIIPALAIDSFVIILFVVLNTLNIKTGTKIQAILFMLKVIPILFVILGGFAIYNHANINFENAIWSGFPATLALVVYAFSGFEASCSLSQSIENAEKNAPRAIIISYVITVCTCLLYQFAAFASIGTNVATLSHFSQLYGIMIGTLLAKFATIAPHIKALMYAAMAASSLGGAYGIMFSNNWNLYHIANDSKSAFFRKLNNFNKHNIAYLCVLAEGLICLFYILITTGNQLPLQQIGAFGCIIAYTISIISLGMGIIKNKINASKSICILAIGNCLILAASTVQSFIATANVFSLCLFLSILTLGVITFSLTKKGNKVY